MKKHATTGARSQGGCTLCQVRAAIRLAGRRMVLLGGIVCPPGLNLALLEERQLFAEKEILRRQGGVGGADREGSQPDQVKGNQR